MRSGTNGALLRHMPNPAIDEFRRQAEALGQHRLIKRHLNRGVLTLSELKLDDVTQLVQDEVAYYLLLGAADLNRTKLKKAEKSAEAQIVSPEKRRAFVIQSRLPHAESFETLVARAVSLRGRDLRRRQSGAIEQLFRERLRDEGIPIVMSPPARRVPGLLIAQRKPDGVYPDPATELAPKLYLEIKRINRVADDIQKRLYEIAEVSLEMKILYGALSLKGLRLSKTTSVAGNKEMRAKVRKQISTASPAVVALLLCSKKEAERYRSGAEAFIDRVFFAEEIDQCLAFLKAEIERLETSGKDK